ncbi:hypothetical protein Tsubulata_006230 [Turnera subulata]|uniref:Tetraspanin n=1 Tax=Turnera subulata TaxID=218843 RepID=A0A9Q0FLV0_9ROSI|nr:hypothetical protein Tsubulata_006230 [Turnera subulata]
MSENARPPPAEAAAPAEDKKKPKEEAAAPPPKATRGKKVKVKSITGLLSLVTMVLSLPVLASAIWLLYMKDYDCEKLLRLPRLQLEIGIGMILLFLISNGAVMLRTRFPIPAFFIVMPALLVLLVMGLALVGAYKMENRRLMATPSWFRERVRNDDNWENIKSCIYSTETCDDLASRTAHLRSYDFTLKKLSFIEYGCCRPPAGCEMEYVNATYWRRGSGYVDHIQEGLDCGAWENNHSVLCYNCKGCRDGFVRLMESKWWKLGVFFILMALLLFICHLSIFIATMLERYKAG